MKKIGFPLVTVLVVIVLLIAFGAGQYNRIIDSDEDVKTQWAQVENQLQRRADLVPNLVNTVKGYASHESEVLTAVTEARARVGAASTPTEQMNANEQLSGALSRLLVVVENYPELKANQNFLDLQAQLEGTENRIAQERRTYNEAVMRYNKIVRKFPGGLFARMMGFQQRATFEATANARNAPEVKF